MEKVSSALWVLVPIVVASDLYLRIMCPKLLRLSTNGRLPRERWKLGLFGYTIPMMVIWGPAFEEVVFRAPLIATFTELNLQSAIWIGISAILFTYIHWRPPRWINPSVASGAKPATYPGRKVLARYTIVVMWGVFPGIIGIYTQSLWLTYSMHAIWNASVASILLANNLSRARQ